MAGPLLHIRVAKAFFTIRRRSFSTSGSSVSPSTPQFQLFPLLSPSAFRRWSEWNGRYRDDVRRFLKGDEGMAGTAITRITGSRDLYDPQERGGSASVNFLTCHDGFTLYDLYSTPL